MLSLLIIGIIISFLPLLFVFYGLMKVKGPIYVYRPSAFYDFDGMKRCGYCNKPWKCSCGMEKQPWF